MGNRKVSVACIGPAEGNLIPFSLIFNDHGHVAATNGPGTVMGSKKIKAIVITNDKNEVDYRDEAFNTEIRKAFLEASDASHTAHSVKAAGTCGHFRSLGKLYALPIKNYGEDYWPTLE